ARAVRTAYDGGPVAVRSSATAEDLADASFAGQQDTYLNVNGADAVLAAVVDCWASLWTTRAMAYRRRQGPDAVSIAVVVQRMVQAESSGVMFTANPANGRRDQTAISAAWGLGESVVGGIVSTDDLVVDAAGVLSRHTADKREMTVYSPTGTEQQPVPAQRRTAPVLDDAAAIELARLGTRIAEHFGAPQDIEWARADGAFSVVQSRPITALPEPVGDRPTTWARPDPTGLYFRASIVEQMPDPLTPLFADLVDGSVGRSISALMAQAFGDDVLEPDDIGLPTINGYAYYHYRLAAFRRILWKSPAAVKMLMGPPATVGGVTGWRDRSHPRYVAAVATWAARAAADIPSVELIDGVATLLDAGTEYYTAVQSIVPLAATSELTFRAFHDRLVRRNGEPAGYTFLLGFDSQPIRAEKSLYDLATAARADPGLAGALSGVEPAMLVGDDSAPDGVDPGAWAVWRAQFRRHLDRFGHTVYNLDFADPVPADEPGPLLDTVRFYLTGQGTDPHERQARVVDDRERWTGVVRARLDPARRA
ncbi:MAG: phosphoenolpyruvate synthase, partial [Pseudonocardia sp.]|nr:phosphoenolpyruvate synthase [Pseudonocardia sp.]